MARPTPAQARAAIQQAKQETDDENPYVIKKPKPTTKDVAWASSFMNGLEPPPVVRRPE